MVQERNEGKTKYRRVEEALKERISGHPAGERLPTLEEIASTYGVSRITARHAVLDLAGESLVTIIHGNGIFTGKVEKPQAKPRRERISVGIQPEIPDKELASTLSIFLYSKRRLAEDAFKGNPNEHNRRTLENAHLRSATFSLLVQATQGGLVREIPPLPNTAGLLTPVLRQTFSEELREIEDTKPS